MRLLSCERLPEVLGQIPFPVSRSHGLYWEHDTLVVVETNHNHVYRLDPANGNVLDEWPTTGVRVITWGPWLDPRDPSLGMVTPPIAALLEERGIPPIRPADGVHALLVEVHHALATGGFEDVIRGDGPWAR